MAFSAGKKLDFRLDNAAGSLTDLTGYTADVQMSDSLAALVTTVAGKNSETRVSGLADSGFSVKLRFDPTAWSTLSAALTGLRGGTVTGGTLTAQYGPAGSATGAPKVSVETVITALNIGTAVDGLAEISLELAGSDDITVGTF